MNDSTRFGQARTVPFKGYIAFHPNPMPETLDISPSTVLRLTEAEAALGRLNGAGRLLPNPHLLIRPYMLREAIASTRIEGTRASLAGVLEAEVGGNTHDPDIEEVVNYIRAMEQGLSLLDKLPFSVRLIKAMHAILLEGVRGRERQPGEIRRTQNWIGPPGCTLETASFVPPPHDELGDLLADWERFANTNTTMPVLIQSALMHYQFETIHPFLDGNGRVGRLLIVFHLILQNRLSSPLLYLSPYFERHRETYYDLLQSTRQTGEADPWFDFFLTGVEEQASDAVTRSERLVDLRERYRSKVFDTTRGSAVALVDVLFAQPVLTAATVETMLDVSRPSALRLLDRFVDMGVLSEMEAGPRRQRRFRAPEILALVTEGIDDPV
ncbi:MAG: Fic family protein [Actinomycetia bacterium]|nr:Fic family protein [Actinomycetes bacterium]